MRIFTAINYLMNLVWCLVKSRFQGLLPLVIFTKTASYQRNIGLVLQSSDFTME